jgi:hypothetical protein
VIPSQQKDSVGNVICDTTRVGKWITLLLKLFEGWPRLVPKIPAIHGRDWNSFLFLSGSQIDSNPHFEPLVLRLPKLEFWSMVEVAFGTLKDFFVGFSILRCTGL